MTEGMAESLRLQIARRDHFCRSISSIKIGQPEQGHETGVYSGSDGIISLVMIVGVQGKTSHEDKTEKAINGMSSISPTQTWNNG